MIIRKKEILETVKTISAGKNAIVYGPLYSGKTTFLKQLVGELDKESISYFFVDCKKCFDEKSFLNEYSKEGLRVLSGKVAGAVKDAYQILPNIKPSISSSGSKGAELSMSYSLTDEDITKFAVDVLQSPYRISKSREEQIVVILDDYENLINIETIKLVEFLSKSMGQGVVYVLSTSDQDMFLSVDKKMQKKLAVELMCSLESFTEAQVKKEVSELFKDQVIEDGAIDYLIMNLFGDIKAIMEFANYYGKNELTTRGIKRIFNSIIEKKEHIFQLYFDSLSVHQKKFIIAIARHTGEHVFKGKFINNNGLISVPSVQTSIKGLVKKQFVYKDNNGIKITDIFFAEWIRRYF